jgi:hypothetical protein
VAPTVNRKQQRVRPEGAGRAAKERPTMAVENDIVLIYYEDAPLVFARIEEILPDHKPGWFHVKMLLLQMPVQVATWILRDVYINGESFTMDGKNVRLEKVEVPERPATAPDEEDAEAAPDVDAPAKVISLTDLKKKK